MGTQFRDKKYGKVVQLPMGDGMGILQGNNGKLYKFRFSELQTGSGKVIGGHTGGFNQRINMGDIVEFRVDKNYGVRILRKHRVGMN